MQYVIIGNGTAGVDAAFAIRQKDPDGKILLLSASQYPHYFRPKLIDYIKEDIPAEKLYIYKDDIFASKNIEVRLNTRITAIGYKNKTVTSSAGDEYRYDKLLLALGASPFIPPTVKCSMEGVFSLRGIKDADRIREY
ncbi:MAG TPA: FAD-dependent oxidoreductase, partial [Spirochaetota bacterium]